MQKYTLCKSALISQRHPTKPQVNYDFNQTCLHLKILGNTMEDGGVDTTVVDSRQHKMGRMADFPSLLHTTYS